MRELTQQEIDQVSAGPTPFAPVAAVPAIRSDALYRVLYDIPLGPVVPFLPSTRPDGNLP
jgi:hypothetical protein